MNDDLSVYKTIQIKAESIRVWDALTDPDILKKVFSCADVKGKWLPHSSVVFNRRSGDGIVEDKGIVKDVIPSQLLSYRYLNGELGLEDRPENYSMVQYLVQSKASKTIVSLYHRGFSSQGERDHSDQFWERALNRLKSQVESKATTKLARPHLPVFF